MRGLFFIAILVSAAFGEQEWGVNETRKWMFAVEEILTSITIGPLKKEFTPQYIGERTEEGVLASQASRLRARVARAIMDSMGTKATVCIDPLVTTAEAAIKAVVDEQKEHGFDAVWVKAEDACPHKGPAILIVNIPPPSVTTKK